MNAPKLPAKPPTIYDVAVAAGVSKSLVSMVLRGEEGVSDARRKKVLKAIEKLDYRPSRFAQQLAGGKTRTIGVVITDYKNLSFIGFLRGLREIFDDAGYQVIVSDLHSNAHFGGDPVTALLAMKVDGLVIAAEVPELLSQNISIPLITVGDRGFVYPGSDLVCNDDFAGVKLALDHLHELGHENIVHVTGKGGVAVKRKNAFVQLMTEMKLKPEVFGIGQNTTEIGGYYTAKELLDSGKQFTAVFATNDSMAAGIWSAFRESGIKIPEDISLIGYDNSPITSEHFLKMSTVDDMGLPVGREAARLLLDHMAGIPSKKPVRKLITPELLVRNTSARVKTKSPKSR